MIALIGTAKSVTEPNLRTCSIMLLQGTLEKVGSQSRTEAASFDEKVPGLPAGYKVLVALVQLHKGLHNQCVHPVHLFISWIVALLHCRAYSTYCESNIPTQAQGHLGTLAGTVLVWLKQVHRGLHNASTLSISSSDG